MKRNRLLQTVLACAVASVVASPAFATLVTWDLNPNGIEGNVGSSSRSYTVASGTSNYTITARGYTNNNGIGTALNLYYKQQVASGGAGEHGLGIVGTTDNELQVGSTGTPLQFIQLDLRMILGQSFGSFTGGQISVGSVQSGETFRLFGSNTLGTLGTQIGSFGSTFDDTFVSIPNFGSFQFISVAAGTGDVLPVAFRANITPVPEMSALFPIVGLLAAVSSTHMLRRRAARSAAKVA